MSDLVVSSLVFSEAGVELTFMQLPKDVRDQGRLVRQQTLVVNYGSPVGKELEALREDVESFADEALDAFNESSPIEPEDDVDEDASMGSG
jgi:hypothetical protein